MEVVIHLQLVQTFVHVIKITMNFYKIILLVSFFFILNNKSLFAQKIEKYDYSQISLVDNRNEVEINLDNIIPITEERKVSNKFKNRKIEYSILNDEDSYGVFSNISIIDNDLVIKTHNNKFVEVTITGDSDFGLKLANSGTIYIGMHCSRLQKIIPGLYQTAKSRVTHYKSISIGIENWSYLMIEWDTKTNLVTSIQIMSNPC